MRRIFKLVFIPLAKRRNEEMVVTPGDVLTTESGDALQTEAGDDLTLES